MITRPAATPARPVHSETRLSRCATYRTDDGGPYGSVTAVRCPDLTHCLHFVPVTSDGRIGPHVSNMTGWRCPWIGSALVDDRAELVGHRYLTRDGITVLLRPGSRTRGKTFKAVHSVRGGTRAG
ncbi:hypothetical protein [Nocardia thraciensis]